MEEGGGLVGEDPLGVVDGGALQPPELRDPVQGEVREQLQEPVAGGAGLESGGDGSRHFT